MQLVTRSNHRKWKSLAWLAMFGVVLALPAGAMTIDTLEGIGSDGTDVTTLLIEGVTVTIAPDNGNNMRAFTYGGSGAFGGASNLPNTPLNPNNVSGTRFISGNPNTFPHVVPIVFSFSSPVKQFGLTTIDLLENAGFSTDTVALVAYDSNSTEIVRHQRTGDQGLSGLDLDWLVTSSSQNILRVELIGDPFSDQSSGLGFGIDDIGRRSRSHLLTLSPAWLPSACGSGAGGNRPSADSLRPTS